MKPEPKLEPGEPALDQAFFDTDDPELRAFAKENAARKLVILVVSIAAMIGSGAGVGWAIYHGLR